MFSKRFKLLFATNHCEPSVFDFLTGVSRYVATHQELELSLSGFYIASNEDFLARNYSPDGVILCNNHPDEHPVRQLKSVKAAVAIHWWSKASLPKKTVAFMNDDLAIAQLAAEHLIGNKLTHFAYIRGNRNSGWDGMRCTAFAKSIRKAGFSCEVLPPDVPGAESCDRDLLKGFLKSLPKPCGIFTSYDVVGKIVLDCCRACSIAVPEQIQVVGVDNTGIICDNTIPTLTSVDVGFTEAGYAAAERLHQMLRGRKGGRQVVSFKPRAIVARGSTYDFRGIGSSVAAACEFMRIHALEPIAPEHVATAVRSSLRTLQLNFQKIRGEGIAEHLRKLRLEHVCRLLRETQMPLKQIPSYCCLGNTAHAKTLFRRTYGLSMSAYRRKTPHEMQVVK